MSLSIRERGTSYSFIRSPYQPKKLLQWRFQAFLYVSLFEKLIWNWKSCRPQYEEQAQAYRISCEIKTPKPGEAGRYSGNENLWYGIWNRRVCHKWNYEVDRPSRSTKVNPGKKQKWCSLSCLWSHVHWHTSGPGISQTLGCLWTKHHRCTYMWNWNHVLYFSRFAGILWTTLLIWKTRRQDHIATRMTCHSIGPQVTLTGRYGPTTGCQATTIQRQGRMILISTSMTSRAVYGWKICSSEPFFWWSALEYCTPSRESTPRNTCLRISTPTDSSVMVS